MGLTDKDYELENNQLDGILAYVLERTFALNMLVSGLKLADTSSIPEKVTCRITMNYKFVL